MFIDRKDAAQKLAQELSGYRGKDAVILALPRGGVVLGAEVARSLRLPLDIVVTRKIGHPNNPEYALCAIDESGTRLCNEAAKTIEPAWLAQETKRQRDEAKRRIALYRGGRTQESLRGRTVIIVDDGIATGLSMRLAVRSVKAREPRRIVVAVPVAPLEAVRDLRNDGADDVIVLEPPERFLGAVGAHYTRFDQVEDAEVISLMKQV